ncbi:H(+)-transporting V1 sector ATPase subunit H [Basidiobolus ranarum]|uniref:H(+)-transporting V1 sector ATPase subunit H n=1 Tax=Basidiobolus ranarum TaxID=34480 RepID=A0ABR2WCT9_9FUNG
MTETFPTSLVLNAHLDELTTVARQKPVSWEDCRGAGLIDEEELRLLNTYDKPDQKYKEISQEEGAVLARVLVNLTDKITRIDLLQHLLVIIDDVLESKEANVSFFHQTSTENPKFPYSPLLK